MGFRVSSKYRIFSNRKLLFIYINSEGESVTEPIKRRPSQHIAKKITVYVENARGVKEHLKTVEIGSSGFKWRPQRRLHNCGIVFTGGSQSALNDLKVKNSPSENNYELAFKWEYTQDSTRGSGVYFNAQYRKGDKELDIQAELIVLESGNAPADVNVTIGPN